LYLFRADVEQAPGLARMWGQYPVFSRFRAGLGDEIEGVGIDHERFVTLQYSL
jgi:hypothetical protein